jgi:hypothetical protein
LLGVVYRKGDSNDEVNNKLLEQFDMASNICNGKILINGDFNLPNIDWVNSMVNDGNNTFSHKFFDKMNDLYLIQHVLEPTRQRGNNNPSCLDLVISSSEHNVSNIKVCCPIGKADHSVITWDFLTKVNRSCKENIYRFDYNKADFVRLRNLLRDVDWSPVTNSTEVNEAWNYFQNHIVEIINECVPLVKINSGGRINPPWFNSLVKKSVRKKYFAWRRYQESRSYARYQEFVKERNAVNKKVRKAKRDYEKNLCKRVKKNSKAFYMYVNSRTKSRSSISKLKNINGDDVDNDCDMADELNSFFQSVFVKEEDKSLIWFNDFMYCIYGDEVSEPFVLNRTGYDSILENIFFSPSDVKKLLLTTNPNKAMGPDEIHPRVLQECAEELHFPMFCIFRQSFDQCKVPENWKFANVIPIFKKGDTSVIGNYRPVSLTSPICKICEKIVRDAIVTFTINKLCDDQHGFRKGRSCVTNLLLTLEEWTSFYDEGLPFDVLYFDFKKAFDSVPHARLIYKLQSNGIVGKLCYWVEDFLKDRKQRVCINSTKSKWMNVTSGVPQGSVLGPVLFLLFVNDLPGAISTKCKLFADDTKVYHPILSLLDYENLQNDINNLTMWSNQWLLGFNEDKCKVLHVGNHNPCHNYFMNGKMLNSVCEEKDLGVLITNKLSFSKHIAKAAAKANSVLGMIRRAFTYIDKESFLVLYKSYVRPHLEYCVQVWSPYLEKDRSLLEKVQRRATKLVPGLQNLSYEDRLNELGLTTLENRRVRGDLIEMYKIMHGFEEIDPSTLFTRRRYNGLRGHELTCEVRRSHLNIRKFNFSNRVVGMWNSLPEHIVTSPDVNTFKN